MRKFPSLDGLRAVSVLLVIFHHLELYYRYTQKQPLPEWLIFFYNGQLGVTFFFVISGFLITTLLIKEEGKKGAVSLKSFFVRRTLRIFPAYYFLLLVYYVLQRVGILQISNDSWLTALTYTKDLRDEDWFTRHAWSLSLEEQFYLCWPFIFVYLKKYRNVFAWVIVALIPFVRIGGYLHPSLWFGKGSNLQRIDALMWGCLLAVYYKPVLQKMTLVLAKYRLLIGVPFVILAGSVLFTKFNFAYRLHMGLLIIALGGETGTVICLAIAAIIVYSINYQKTVWYSILNLRLITFIGTISYSLYLWQQIFICTHFPVSVVPLNLVCILIAANISYFCVERPFLQLRDRFTKSNNNSSFRSFNQLVINGRQFLHVKVLRRANSKAADPRS